MLDAGKAEDFVVRIIDAKIKNKDDGDAEEDGARHGVPCIGNVAAEIHRLLITAVSEEDRNET